MEKKIEKVEQVEEPLFVRFLEDQDFPGVKSGIKAGKPDQTMKYPSDSDEI